MPEVVVLQGSFKLPSKMLTNICRGAFKNYVDRKGWLVSQMSRKLLVHDLFLSTSLVYKGWENWDEIICGSPLAI